MFQPSSMWSRVLILLAGIAACVAYWFRAVRPRLRQLRAVRKGILDLPVPFGPGAQGGWPEAMHGLGNLLRGQATFVSAWSEFQAKAAQARGIPNVPVLAFRRFRTAAGAGQERLHGLAAGLFHLARPDLHLRRSRRRAVFRRQGLSHRKTSRMRAPPSSSCSTPRRSNSSPRWRP